MAKTKNIGGESPTNGAKDSIESNFPYNVNVEIEGTSDILFHRWNCESVEAKSNAAKGSKAKKSDDIETYVYRNENNELCIPGEYLRMSIINAAKFKQDPRSPRKSAMDLFKAGVVSLTNISSLGIEKWDYEDKRRVVIQRAGISRIRPAMKSGWKASFDFLINLPEYIPPHDFHEAISLAGKLIGIGDFRPSYGRFIVTSFQIL